MDKRPILEKLEKLDRETEDLFTLLSGLKEEDLHDSCYGWSIIQVFTHLNMSEAGSVMYMRKKMLAGDQMPDYTLLGRLRYFFTKRLLQSSLKWKAPKVVSSPEGNYSLQEIKDKWSKTREMTKSFVEEYPVDWLKKAVYKHPFTGRLDLEGAIGSFIYHQRHHVHQISRIRKKIGR